MKKKKILIALGIFLCIILIATIANCSGDDTESEETNTSSIGNDTHNNTTTTWTINEEKDEFDLPTGEKYLKTTVSGTFNNFMGKDQKLTAEIHASADDVTILLWEYGTSQLESLYDDSQQFKITVLDQNNTKHQYIAYLYDGKPYLIVMNFTIGDYIESVESMLKILETPGTVSFYIVNSDDEDNTYSFSIKTDGFADLYKQILPQQEETAE